MNSKLTGMAVVVALVLALPSCNGDSERRSPQLSTQPWGEPGSGQTLEITVLAQGHYPHSGVPGPRAVQKFDDAEELAAALAQYDSGTEVPEVDFTANRVVLLSHGWAASGGYQIAVQGAFEHEQMHRKVLLDVALIRPGGNCVVTDAITSPYQFVMIPSTRELVVRERRVTEPCNGEQESADRGSLLEHTVFAKGQGSSNPPHRKLLQALDNADDLADLWHAIDPGEPVPEVDFDNNQVVLLAQGWRPNTSYGVELHRVLDKGDHLQLDIDLVRGGRGCLAGDAMVLPYQFVQIPDTRRVVFNERIRADDCE